MRTRRERVSKGRGVVKSLLRARVVWPAGIILLAAGVLWVVSAIGADKQQPNGDPPAGSAAQEQAGGEAIEVTDTAAPGAAMAVTDITAALSSDLPSTTTTGQTTSTSTSTSSTSTTTAASRLPRRTQHAHWDDRLPGTRKGLRATKCHRTFRVPVYHPPTSWDYDYRKTGGFGHVEDWLIAFALSDSSWEPAPGTLQHEALTGLRVASAQEIRDRGEAAMDVRWYAWFVTYNINEYGDPTNASCASILAGAEAVFATPAPTPAGSGKAVPRWTKAMAGRSPG